MIMAGSKKWRFVCAILLHNATNDTVVIRKMKTEHSNCYFVMRTFTTKDNREQWYGRSFPQKDLVNGKLRKYLEKITKDCEEFEDKWTICEDESAVV